MLQLDYRDSRPIYAQIADRYRAQITAGILRHGDRLPSVRELACRLAINPNTIQRAYRELEMEGWIASVPGKGSFVCGAPGEPVGEQLALLEAFDKVAEELLKKGISREALIARLTKGGSEDA